MDDGSKSSEHVRKIKRKRQDKDIEMADDTQELESELDENEDDLASDKIKHQKSKKTAMSAKKKQDTDEKYVEPSKPTKKKKVVVE